MNLRYLLICPEEKRKEHLAECLAAQMKSNLTPRSGWEQRLFTYTKLTKQGTNCHTVGMHLYCKIRFVQQQGKESSQT